MSESPQPYRVLARKYRPQSFAELIGQDAMVTTLGNAIRRDRLAHAFLLTGVRGVGKTSTARLIAKALNCIGPDGQGGPTIDPCGVCEPCRAIAEGRHIDVVEMDAASHTGVDDVREIIEAVRYAAVSARYKIYIIDEVHMLSKNAFNALLKTLEEPPPHVKFLFATTEVNKVPITVLSRCQRFDLKRISAETLGAHFARVVEAEGVEADPEALALIARAAEGSARDGLSILDQAIAHGSGKVEAAQVRDMLGLSDRGAIRRLFGDLLSGDAEAVLAGVRGQYDLGVEPAALLHGLLETCHGVTRAKVSRTEDPAMSVEEREALAEWASKLGFATLHKLWQLLLKGHGEVQSAAMPIEAAEMALLRVVHASQMPDPGELARKLLAGEITAPAGGVAPAAAPSSAPAPAASAPVAPAAVAVAEPPAPPPLPADAQAIHDLLEKAHPLLAVQFNDHASVIRLDGTDLAIARNSSLPLSFANDLANALKKLTGQVWTVSIAEGQGEPSLRARELAAEHAVREEILASPLVRAAMEAFPGAEMVEFTPTDKRLAS
ncbi:DNA polymerase III subunit gamma/tau [Sphingomonas crocodyli]|uniref:DNA polymerase III subunit gamma/tau n=1 Tax=Sphingomonas crocodyli TaxID=1979270 RepID=A0A437M0Z3_9SPHN|nr:DNA polymerase III subunit gamma/tau [Sphingomonas crocodyli]RVT91235.1 DNA polymerase III subunit gamma/tau [Sphingomonas crocodyli]